MTKILEAIQRMPEVFSTTYTSTNKYYLEFLAKFKTGIIDIGSMNDDKINYTQDLRKVHKDFKRASIKAKQKMADCLD